MAGGGEGGGRSRQQRAMVDRTQGNDDGVDWDVLNHGVDHCRRECPGQPGCRLLLLDWPDLGERSGRLTAQRRPPDGWHSQMVRTSGFQWGYFVKLWVARRLDRVLRIDLSSRCRAPIHAWPGMFRACVHSRAESTEGHSKDICATRAACTGCRGVCCDGHRQAGQYCRHGWRAGRTLDVSGFGLHGRTYKWRSYPSRRGAGSCREAWARLACYLLQVGTE